MRRGGVVTQNNDTGSDIFPLNGLVQDWDEPVWLSGNIPTRSTYQSFKRYWVQWSLWSPFLYESDLRSVIDIQQHTKVSVGSSQDLFKLIQAGCLSLCHGWGPRGVLVSYTSHHGDGGPVGQGLLSVERRIWINRERGEILRTINTHTKMHTLGHTQKHKHAHLSQAPFLWAHTLNSHVIQTDTQTLCNPNHLSPLQ